MRQFTFAAHDGPKANSCSTRPLAEDLVVVDGPRDAFHALRFLTVQFKVLAGEPFDGSRDDDPSRRCETGDPGRQVRGQTVYIVLFKVEVDHPAMHADADLDGEAETLLYPFTEAGDFPRDVETRVHRSPRVVLVRSRVTENDQQPVALGGGYVPLVAVDDLANLLLVAADDGAVRLRLDAGGQRG
jgi:hypothetical protein